MLALAAGIAASAWAGSVTYIYDQAGRLKQVQYDDGAQVTYTLDAAGNRTQVTSTASTPVNPPTGLTVQSVTASSISLSWTAATGGTGQFTYKLYRSTSSGTGGTLLAANFATTSWTDGGVAAHTTYYYTVSAVDSDGTPTAQTSAVSGTPYAFPVITSFTGAPASASQINLTWSAGDTNGPGLSGFKLYRNGSIVGTLAAAATSYSDAGLATGTSYSYMLVATDLVGDPSPTANTSAATYTLPALSGLTLTSPSPTSMTIMWSGSDTGGPGGLTYSVVRGSTTLGCTSSPCTDTGLASATQYSYTVTATDSVGDTSSASASQYTIPGSPGAITVSAIGTNSATISWTGASGYVNRYEYSLNGGASWTNVGTATITNVAGLSSGTTYTVLVHAVNVGGTGPATSAQFTTIYVDTPVMTAGNNQSGSEGFSTNRGFGSMSPATTSNGITYKSFADLAPVGSGKYNETAFSVSGLTSDPGKGWLVSASVNGFTETGASASNYIFNAGIATWVWTNGPGLPDSGTYTCTIIHY
jgi:YD repeat-containing protein